MCVQANITTCEIFIPIHPSCIVIFYHVVALLYSISFGPRTYIYFSLFGTCTLIACLSIF